MASPLAFQGLQSSPLRPPPLATAVFLPLTTAPPALVGALARGAAIEVKDLLRAARGAQNPDLKNIVGVAGLTGFDDSTSLRLLSQGSDQGSAWAPMG